MFRRILCVLLAAAVIIVSFGGCGRQIKTVKVAKADSTANFAAYKNEIIKIMDESGVQYEYSEMETGNEAGTDASDPTLLIMKFSMKTQLKEELIVGLKNKDKIEGFTVSLAITRKSLDECDLNIRDYAYARKIFNLVSDIDLSAFGCNRLMQAGRKGIEEEYKENPDSLYRLKNRFFGRDKTKTWFLQYTIYLQTASETLEFEETLAYKGNLAPRTAS